MAKLFDVDIEGIGVVRYVADSLKAAQKWARSFKGRKTHVSRPARKYNLCDLCDSKPCCCQKEE